MTVDLDRAFEVAKNTGGWSFEETQLLRDGLVHLQEQLEATAEARDSAMAGAIARSDELRELREELKALENGCEQALLLLERKRFEDDPEAKVVRAVLKGALGSNPPKRPS